MPGNPHGYVLPLTEVETLRLHRQAHYLDRSTNPLLARYVRPGMNCIELGCGLGASTQTIRELLGRAGSLTAVDQGAAFLNYTRGRLDKTGNPGVEFVNSLAEDFEFPPESDLIFGRAVLHHTRAPQDVFRRAASSLSRGGFVVFQEPVVSAIHRNRLPEPVTQLWHWYAALGEFGGFHFDVGDDLAGYAHDAGLEIVEMSGFEPMLVSEDDLSVYPSLLQVFGDQMVSAGLAEAADIEAAQRGLEVEAKRGMPLPYVPFTHCVAMRPLHAA
ncbi:MAG: methyltransferase domain-containing protein [Pseudomonadota bacterium]